MPLGVMRRSADNFRSLLAVADACGGDWPRRAREAAIALIGEMNAEQPKVPILRHGLMLFNHFETDWLEVHRFNRELRNLGAPEFDWNCYRERTRNELPPDQHKRTGAFIGRGQNPLAFHVAAGRAAIAAVPRRLPARLSARRIRRSLAPSHTRNRNGTRAYPAADQIVTPYADSPDTKVTVSPVADARANRGLSFA